MRWLLVVVSVLLLPLSTFAAVDVTPDTYAAPANVTTTGGDGTNRFNLYDSSGNFICQTNNPTGATVNLNDQCVVYGGGTVAGFNGVSSTPDVYYVNLQTVTDCNGTPPLNHAACAAANPNIPGSNEDSFEICDPYPCGSGGSSSSASTTYDAIEKLTSSFVLFASIVLFLFAYGWWWYVDVLPKKR